MDYSGNAAIGTAKRAEGVDYHRRARDLVDGRSLYAATEPADVGGGAFRYLLIGLALGVIVALLLSGNNLTRFRLRLGNAILPPSARLVGPLPALPAAGCVQASAAVAPSPIASPIDTPALAARPQLPAAMALSATPSLGAIPVVDVSKLPRHAPPPRTAAAPGRRNVQRSAPDNDGTPATRKTDEAPPLDAKMLEATLK